MQLFNFTPLNVRRGSCAYFGGGPKLECYGTAAEYNYRNQKVLEIGFLQYKSNANVFFGNCLHLECTTTVKAPAVTQEKCHITDGVP